MELKTGRSRAGSVAAGGYDELLTPLICEAQSEPTRGVFSAEDGRGFDSNNSRGGVALVSKRSSRSSQNGRQMSVRSRKSAHGAEIRRQGSGGGQPDGGGGLRVKSTVSGFLNRDYYTPNDSVPLIRVSESYTRLFHHTSDEDTDSEVEEVIEKKFGTEAKNLKDALKTNFAVRKAAVGIPRMEGHMRLPDRKTAYTDAKDRLYRGQNYLVELPYRLERSTRALTRTAIARALEEERTRRVSELRQRGAAVSEDWLSVQAELRRLAQAAQQEDVETTITATQGCEDHMELVREQLVHSVHRKTVRAEVAEAQQWKQMFFKGISKNKLPPDAMEAVASTSENMSSMLGQLQEAFMCSELDESSRREVVQERAQDLKDGCLTELLRCVATQKITIEITIETERQTQEFKRGRPVAARKSGSQDGVDLGAAKQAVGGSLAKIFKRVDDREVKREDRVRDRVSEFKTVCQEELIRKVWRRKVTALCSHEKARRIVESEDPAVMADPDRARITDHWVRVQAQMIVDKFMGKKPMKKTSVTEVLQDRSGSPSPIRSALDRRLKAVRERFRRPAVYFCDEDDTFIRERARRRTSLSSPSQGRLGSRSSLAHSSASEPARRRRSSGGSSSPSPRRSQPAATASRSRRAPASRSSQSRQQSPTRQPSASRSSSRQQQSVGVSPSHKSSATRQSSSTRSPSRQPSSTRSPSRQPSSTRSPSRQPSSTRSPSRQPSSTRSPSRQPSSTRSPSRQPSSSRSPSRQPSSTRSPSRQPSASRSPSRQPASSRSQSKQSSVGRSASRQSSSAAAAAGGSPRRQSANSSSRQTVTAKRGSRRQSAASGGGGGGGGSRRQSAAAPGASRSASYASARSSVSPESRRSSTRRRSGPGDAAAGATGVAGGSRSPPSAGILKNTESTQRASSAAASPRRESRTKPSRSSTSAARADPGSRRSSAGAGAGAEPRRSPSGGGSARRGRSGGDMKEVMTPRRLASETEAPEAVSRSYRKRGEKTAEFQQDRRAIADKREHELSQKLERKRSRSAGKTSDQYRSHWTAHIQE